jgi:hypothetical protein
MKAWRVVLVLVAVLLCCGLPERGAAGPRLDLLGVPSMVAWDPSESYEGRAQADPRLDKTVRFWDTGVPAADVFATLTSQTGVALGFFPPHDENTRICLNLYLNPKQPPTLRSLLVQIGWALDCAWAVEGEGEQRRYILLSTSIGSDVLEQLRKEGGEAARALGRESEAAQREAEEIALAKLNEIGDALSLSRDEVIKRYKGKDNLMLLALLDPAKRAMAQFCLSLDGEQLRQKHGASLKWQDLSAEQQGFLRSALEPELKQTAQGLREGWMHPDSVRDMGWSANDHWEDWDWVEREILGDLRLDIYYGFVLNSNRQHDQPERPQLPPVFLRLHRDPRDPGTMQPSIGNDLYRLLGEVVPDEPDPEFEGERRDVREYREEQQRALIERQLTSLRHLSPAVIERLASLRLPAAVDKPYALWQLQEAVTALSGINVVSDNFWQPPRSAKQILDLLHRDQPQEPNALLLLQMTTVATETRERLLYGPIGPTVQLTRWEWGDAGEFLRFRSADRDVWRAALMPAEVLGTLQAWLAPRLPEDLAHAKQVTVPLDALQCAGLLKGLNYLQRRWGGVLTYGRPLNELEQWRASFHRDSLAALREDARFYLWLSGLSDEQWKQAHGKGLHIGVELAPGPDPDDSPLLSNSTLRVRSITQKEKESLRASLPGSDWCVLEFVADNTPNAGAQQRALPTQVTIRPLRLDQLVPPPS